MSLRRWTWFLASLFAFILAPAAAGAATYRVAVVVGHNAGNSGEKPLHFAEDDAGKVSRVLVELGGVAADDLLLLQGKGLASVKEALGRAGKRVAEIQKNPEDRALLLFYFSGHSDGEALELGKERLPFADLKSWLSGTGADVRVAIVDSCKSGALVREKGGKPGPAFEIKLADELTSSGEAFLTSSAADEKALESSEIRGGFFTHYLVSGLRGAADQSEDGRVTLSEAYQYAYHRTVSSSASTGADPQHPEYDFRLSGQGELILTEKLAETARIQLPEGFERALVVHVQRDQVVAELRSDDRRVVAVAPGEYAVRLWQGGKSLAGRVKVAEAEERVVEWKELTTMTASVVQAKGEPERDELADRAEKRRRLAARAAFESGYITFADDMQFQGGSYTPSGSNWGWLFGTGTAKAGYTAFQGKWRQPLNPEEFYNAVGRSDLAESYSRRQGTRVTLMIGGIVAGVVGFGVMAHGASAGGEDEFGEPKMDENEMKIGTLIVVGGLVMWVVGRVMNPHPVSVSEAHAIAVQHNNTLESAIEPGDEDEARRPPKPAPFRLAITPAVTGSGAGLVVVGTF
jgi:hypothetical protein